MTDSRSYPEHAALRQVLGAFYKTVDVMKSARNSKSKMMSVWPDDMKAVEDVMLFLEGLRDADAPAQAEPEYTVPKRLLDERDNFIVQKGLWSEFVSSLPEGK